MLLRFLTQKPLEETLSQLCPFQLLVTQQTSLYLVASVWAVSVCVYAYMNIKFIYSYCYKFYTIVILYVFVCVCQ